jgi:glycerol-3-phosphate acyltransferase PlsY
VRLAHKQDIRTIGTFVTGAYNVSKVSGKKGFIITFLGDAIKGALAVLLCRLLDVGDFVTMLCIFMVLAGHILPFQLKFKGGRGLSTALGAFLTFQPMIIIYWLITSIILFPFVRRYTVTVLFALMFLPLEMFIFNYPLPVILFFLLYTALILYACRSNFKEYLKERAYHGRNLSKK